MKKFSIILVGFLFTIIGLPNINAEEYESYNIGDAVIFNGIGGHVIDKSDSSSSTVKVFVDGWNKTKDEWDAYWDKYSIKMGYKNFASLLNANDGNNFFDSLIVNKNNYQFEDATVSLLDEFVDINFIDSKYWNDYEDEPVNGGWISGSENPGLQYVISPNSNVPSWMIIDNINFFGNTFSSNSSRNLCSGGLDGYSSVMYCEFNNVGFVDDIFSGGMLTYSLGEIEYSKSSTKILGLGNLYNKAHLILRSYAKTSASVPVVVIEKDNIDSVNRTTVVYEKDNSVSEIIKYKNTGIYEEKSECKGVTISQTINLTLNYNNGEENKIKSIEIGSNFDEIPTNDGYEFAGWYYDAELNERFYDEVYTEKVFDENGCQTGYSDLVLYAKWIKVFKSEDVSIFAINNELDNVDSIEIKAIENDDKIRNFVEKKLNQFKVYDITLLDNNGNNVQPSGKVKLSIRIPEKFDKNNIEVYRVDGEQLINYDVVIDGDNAIIETDHFSNYIIGEKIVTKNPNTGDNGITYIFLCSVLVGFFIVVANRFNKIKQV